MGARERIELHTSRTRERSLTRPLSGREPARSSLRRLAPWLVMSMIAASCEQAEESAPRAAESVTQREDAPTPTEEGVRLGVPPATIARARREAAGLSRMPAGLRAQALARGRERAAMPTYEALRADPAAHEGARVSYEGLVALARPAGPGLTIMAIKTRRDGERWTDPLYVLSVVRPAFAPDGAITARIDGWVVGERTIGRHALPLVIAFDVERIGHP